MQRASLLARRFRRLPHAALRLAAKAAGRWPVSDEKIGFEYKLKRFLEGCQMPALRAHVYWGGTFSDSEKQRLVKPALPEAFAPLLAQLPAAKICLRICGSTKNIIFPTTSHQGRPDEHGSRSGSTAAIPRSPHRGIRPIRYPAI